MKENLTAPIARFLEENSPRTSGFTGCAFTGLPFCMPKVFLQFWTVSSGVWSPSEIETRVLLV